MAERLDAFPENRGSKPIYPWDEWMDGSVWKITKGLDFKGEAASFKQNIYGQARRAGKKVRATIEGNTVIFQFYEIES